MELLEDRLTKAEVALQAAYVKRNGWRDEYERAVIDTVIKKQAREALRRQFEDPDVEEDPRMSLEEARGLLLVCWGRECALLDTLTLDDNPGQETPAQIQCTQKRMEGLMRAHSALDYLITKGEV